MIPILFDADARDFTSRGLGPLSDAVSCKVVEERNSTYELVMQYPKDGIHFEDIGLNKIILAIPSPYREAQPFRIYKISTPMRGVVTINAQHISYDLSGVAVMPFSGNSVADILNKIKLNSVNQNDFEFTGNSDFSAECVYSTPYTARQILGGIEGSVIDRFGGEYEFDKFTVKWNLNRGANNGVTVRYGKNLLTLNQDVDVSKIFTGVIPYWVDSEGGSTVVGDLVNMDGEYSFEKVIPLDLSQEFEEQPTKEQLNSRAKTYINANYSLEPEINCTVSFALIEQYEEYKDFKLLEQCDLCDIVTVQYPDLGVNSTAKIVKIETDVLKGRYNSVTIGSVRANIAQTIVAQQKAVQSVPSKFDVSQLVRNSLDKITGAQGGTVRFLDTNGDGEPDTLYIADNPNPAEAEKVWRFNYLGWAASSNGYNGPFTLGATLEDGLLADFVTAANLTAGTIKSADNGETFFLDLLNGVLRMKASSFSIEGKTVDDIAGEAADSALSEANDYTDKSASNTLDSANKYADSAASEAVNDFVSAVYDPKIESLQNQIDGQIESYFYDEVPTLSNEPAVNWKTDTEKQKHEGDLFFNKSTGYAYRFFKEGNTWKWQQVQDTDITKALEDASKAQDTADKKRRVFVTTPYTPYDVGDLWVQGSTGDIMKCKSARQSGNYDPSDWDKASKYTDDTAANAAEAHATKNSTAIETNNKEIALRATKEELDALGNRVTTAESTIKQNSDSIALKVTADDVNSLIEQKADSIRMKAGNISWEAENSSMAEDGTFTCENANIGGKIVSKHNVDSYTIVSTVIDPESGLILSYQEIKTASGYTTAYRAQNYNLLLSGVTKAYSGEELLNEMKRLGPMLYNFSDKTYMIGQGNLAREKLILRTYSVDDNIVIDSANVLDMNASHSIQMESDNTILIKATGYLTFGCQGLAIRDESDANHYGYTGEVNISGHKLKFVNGICTLAS